MTETKKSCPKCGSTVEEYEGVYLTMESQQLIFHRTASTGCLLRCMSVQGADFSSSTAPRRTFPAGLCPNRGVPAPHQSRMSDYKADQAEAVKCSWDPVITVICPECFSSSFRPSRFRMKDFKPLLLLHWPVRCRRCHHRTYARLPFTSMFLLRQSGIRHVYPQDEKRP